MSARGELTTLILGKTAPRAADAILAAGYTKPRTVTTRDEVAALPEGSVLIDSAGDVAQLRHGLWCSYETAAMTHGRMAKYTPATVLYEPTA
ncbi:hypothetical protein [Arthrobacter sp. PsM3]|uniref:hypothetical protein n=1 Tax=Arthrobacter sp. PsM3 TaxID=3030531 RepID=UPI00263ACB8C|nr:hypothetical protein [Arthrobacter sp. PsM3]MDN4644956.1 hypothetical protein [Arthrobacter sp. PsM3]